MKSYLFFISFQFILCLSKYNLLPQYTMPYSGQYDLQRKFKAKLQNTHKKGYSNG